MMKLIFCKDKSLSIILLLVFMSFRVPSSIAQGLPRVELIILEDGVYDSLDVIRAIEDWSLSVKDSSGLICSIIRLPVNNNSPQGIDTFIENRDDAGVHIFMLVGNDLKWPLFTYENGGAPASGILSDTDGELSIIGDGLNSVVIQYTSEVTVSYVFPPKYSSSGELLADDVQRQLVIQAFNKFQRYHEGLISYEPIAVISGNFKIGLDSMFSELYNASTLLLGENNTVMKELNRTEVKSYFSLAPLYFVAEGHGGIAQVQTSSEGDMLYSVDLITNDKTPLFMELAGCWVNGHFIQNATDPWGAKERSLVQDGIFSNNYTVAIVAGIPESGIGTSSSTGESWFTTLSFSKDVIREMSQLPARSIGELMIGKTRHDGSWAFFGDPTIRFGNLQEGVSSTVESEVGNVSDVISSVEELEDVVGNVSDVISSVEELEDVVGNSSDAIPSLIEAESGVIEEDLPAISEEVSEPTLPDPEEAQSNNVEIPGFRYESIIIGLIAGIIIIWRTRYL